jgi:hypothetical protein
MSIRIESSSQVGGSGSVGRGAAWLAAVGFVLGGVAGTVDRPVVGTFFGAVGGAGVGAVAGVLVGVVLAIMAASTRSRLVVRLVSAALAGGAALAGTAAYPGAVDGSRLVAVAWVVAAAVLAGCVAPLIAYGTGAEVAAGLPSAGARILFWGAIVGAGAGAAIGLAVGARAYLPTAPFAAVEGGILGVVSGLVVACIVAGVVVLPRWRARR